jgi:hypothetical protein
MSGTELGTWDSKMDEIFLIFINSWVIQSLYCYNHLLPKLPLYTHRNFQNRNQEIWNSHWEKNVWLDQNI